jgi:hypothetical protein
MYLDVEAHHLVHMAHHQWTFWPVHGGPDKVVLQKMGQQTHKVCCPQGHRGTRDQPVATMFRLQSRLVSTLRDGAASSLLRASSSVLTHHRPNPCPRATSCHRKPSKSRDPFPTSQHQTGLTSSMQWRIQESMDEHSKVRDN